MKHFCTIAALWLLTACSSQQKATLSNTSSNQAKAAPVEPASYAKLTFVASQKDYMPMMQGTWLVHTMQRQATMPEETLYLLLHLNNDLTYLLNTPCGDMHGRYSVKGMSIRFLDASYNSNQCSDVAKFNAMTKLLTNTVSLYAYNGNMLFLKDNSGNNVFRATR